MEGEWVSCSRMIIIKMHMLYMMMDIYLSHEICTVVYRRPREIWLDVMTTRMRFPQTKIAGLALR